jgi:hypothetical protein
MSTCSGEEKCSDEGCGGKGGGEGGAGVWERVAAFGNCDRRMEMEFRKGLLAYSGVLRQWRVLTSSLICFRSGEALICLRRLSIWEDEL